MIPPILIDLMWAVLGGAGAVVWESAARHPEWSWTKLLMVYVPAQLLIATAVYHVMAGAPRFLGGILVFTGAVWVIRILVSQFYFMETVPLKTWIACAIVVTAAVTERLTG